MDCRGLHLVERESEAPDLKLHRFQHTRELCPVRPGLLSHCDVIPRRSSVSPPLKRTAPFDKPPKDLLDTVGNSEVDFPPCSNAETAYSISIDLPPVCTCPQSTNTFLLVQGKLTKCIFTPTVLPNPHLNKPCLNVPPSPFSSAP